ncbi:hypothetical protein BCR43DRAFT_487187, partial [Syncephalastrum racemosum]
MGKDRFNFNFPLLVSAIHALLQSIVTTLMMSLGGDRWNNSKQQNAISTSAYLLKVVS